MKVEIETVYGLALLNFILVTIYATVAFFFGDSTDRYSLGVFFGTIVFGGLFGFLICLAIASC